jgi:cytochrome P450
LQEFLARHGHNPQSRLPLARLVAGNSAQGAPPLSDAQIADEVALMMLAGTDTSATVLTYLFFELARHPKWYARVRREVCAAAAAAADAPRRHDSRVGAEVAPSRRVGHESRTTNDNNNSSSSHTYLCSGQSDNAGVAESQGDEEPLPQLPPHAALQSLPALNAVIWETLRLYSPVPGSSQREVPRGGAPVSGAGCWLPEGTLVNVHSYSVQRDASVFPQPRVWQPARWIASKSAPTVPLGPSMSSASSTSSSALSGATDTRNSGGRVADKTAKSEAERMADDVLDEGQDDWTCFENDAMRAHMLVFSKGVRACLGKPIALLELKLLAAALVQRFATLHLADERQTVDDMTPRDHLLLLPKGRRCNLVFKD